MKLIRLSKDCYMSCGLSTVNNLTQTASQIANA